MTGPKPLLALGLAALAGIAAAQQGRNATMDSLRPTGPVTVTADRADWEQSGVMVYTGNVLLSSDTLKLKGDRLELRQLADGQFTASVTGNPAQLDHPGLKEKDGSIGPPVGARAKTLNYDSRSSMVDILGNAQLTRGEDAINGDDIHYDVAQRRIRAAGGQGGQVRIVIQPPPAKGSGGSSSGGGRAAPAARAPQPPPPPPAVEDAP
ncbi:MAG TPA: lipopolysaccharide transport periplasmic protein LptA [Solimonas sp.]|nr:lipopolysaccharide transport periplasmic protein LptA [Solimonas sp.]